MAPPTLEDGRLALHEPFDEDAMQRQTLGLLVFLPAAAATVVLAVFWVNRILYPPPRMLMPPASRAVDRLPSPNPPPRSVVARPYSLYDLIAGCGTTFLINLCITVVVPAALSSAENRGHDSPLTASGSVAAASALGMVISVIVMYPWPTELVEGKLPALVFAAFLLIGNVAFLGVEWVGAELHYLLACRVLMSLGFGAGYAAKQRAGSEPDPRRREYLFMLLELASSLGMASGPILTGGLTLVWPHNSALLPPTLMIFLAIAFALVLLTCPLRSPFSYSLPDRAAKSAAVTGGGGDGSDSVQLQAASKEGGMRPVESTPLVSGGGAGGGGRGPGGGVATWVAATVQVTCLLLGVTRCFLKYGFESAMVVVYDRQLMMSEGAAGVVAGACGLSAVVSTLVYKGVCAGRYRSSTLLLVAEARWITPSPPSPSHTHAHTHRMSWAPSTMMRRGACLLLIITTRVRPLLVGRCWASRLRSSSCRRRCWATRACRSRTRRRSRRRTPTRRHSS